MKSGGVADGCSESLQDVDFKWLYERNCDIGKAHKYWGKKIFFKAAVI